MVGRESVIVECEELCLMPTKSYTISAGDLTLFAGSLRGILNHFAELENCIGCATDTTLHTFEPPQIGDYKGQM